MLDRNGRARPGREHGRQGALGTRKLAAREWQPGRPSGTSRPSGQPTDLVAIVAPGSVALFVHQGEEREVVIEDYLYNPAFGWYYRFQDRGVAQFPKASLIHRILGKSEMVWYDPIQLRVTTRVAS